MRLGGNVETIILRHWVMFGYSLTALTLGVHISKHSISIDLFFVYASIQLGKIKVKAK